MKTTATQPKKATEPETSRAATQPDQRPAATAQRQQQADINASPRQQNQALPAQLAAPNRTGLPDQLKAGVENLSGYSLDDVQVHYNSAKPAQLQAHAYAQGTDIHVAPGQEQHLPHEAWHVVQQKQGRVAATRQMKGGVAVNDDAGLEQEADVMGERADFMQQNKIPIEKKLKQTDATRIFQLVKITSNLRKKVDNWAKNKAQEVLDWFAEDENTKGLEKALEMNFADWWKNVYNNDGTSTASVANPYATVNTKIKASGYDISKFTSEDRDEVIKYMDVLNNWTSSIKIVYDSIIAREEKAIRDARIAKFVSARAAGDAIFTNGLVKAVWDYTWGVFTSADPKNITLPESYSDATIEVAVNAWRGHATIHPLNAAADQQPITNIHVPGGAEFIQDKSTRAENPDPSRGRQADFKSTWGGLDINIHVNSTRVH